MLIIDQIRISILETNPKAALGREAARILHIPPHKIRQLRIRKRSIDARKKPDIFLLYSVSVEVDGEKTLWRSVRKNRNVRQDNDLRYRILSRRISFEKRPVVVGFGPAGMFASYILALSGANPIVVERGRAAEERKKDVERFFETGNLLPESNVQFGEGGAGTFSDGKLVTQKNDRFGRNRFVLETFHKFGADESVLYDAKPHIGTDKLVEIVSAMRREIERLGGTVYFETRMESLLIEGGCVKGVVLSDGTTLESDHVLLGIGHSARDTFAQLFSQGVPMQAKPFAVGFRVEHPQERISRMQYGKKAAGLLPPAPYKLVVKSERPLYSFCMCPGGFVVNASSEPGRLCVNGMSESKRDCVNANSALVLPVDPESEGLQGELSEGYPLVGLQYQQKLEEAAFHLADGRIPQQLLGDFVANRKSTGYGRFSSCTQGERAFVNLRGLLGKEMEESWIHGVRAMDEKMRGFWDEEMILSGVESRTSSPVRILRNEAFESTIHGLYPCGEGAGYAGGITSAAMDGMKAAEAVVASQGEV